MSGTARREPSSRADQALDEMRKREHEENLREGLRCRPEPPEPHERCPRCAPIDDRLVLVRYLSAGRNLYRAGSVSPYTLSLPSTHEPELAAFVAGRSPEQVVAWVKTLPDYLRTADPLWHCGYVGFLDRATIRRTYDVECHADLSLLFSIAGHTANDMAATLEGVMQKI